MFCCRHWTQWTTTLMLKTFNIHNYYPVKTDILCLITHDKQQSLLPSKCSETSNARYTANLWLHATQTVEYGHYRSFPRWLLFSFFCLLCHMDLQPTTESLLLKNCSKHKHMDIIARISIDWLFIPNLSARKHQIASKTYKCRYALKQKSTITVVCVCVCVA